MDKQTLSKVISIIKQPQIILNNLLGCLSLFQAMFYFVKENAKKLSDKVSLSRNHQHYTNRILLRLIEVMRTVITQQPFLEVQNLHD